MNIVYYKGHDYFDYMKYYNPNDINIFIGGRGTGKTYSIYKDNKTHFLSEDNYAKEYEYRVSSDNIKFFVVKINKISVITRLSNLKLKIGDVYSFLRLEDFESVREVFPNEVTYTIE